MRLQTYIKNNGGYTKSEVMNLQNEGRILVNGVINNLSYNLKDNDVVTIDGEVITKVELSYYLYNKPIGVVCTNDKNVTNNIISTLNIGKRIYPVGRLDKDTHGLIILTKDNKLTHYVLENKEIEKEYIVVISGIITTEFINKMKEPIMIHGKLTIPAKVRKISDHALSVTLVDGRYHEVRSLVKNGGERLVDLKRVRIGKISLDDYNLSPGDYIEVPELKNLL